MGPDDPVRRMDEEQRQAATFQNGQPRPLVIDLVPALQLEYWRGVALGVTIGLLIGAALMVRIRE